MLCTEITPKINYDAEYDVMNYIIGDTSNSYGDEDTDNIVVLKDIDTDDITGYTVMNFKRICDNKSSEYNELLNIINMNAARNACGLS